MTATAPSIAPDVFLIVNGDDFGRSAGINRGILECYDRGILTSASLMTVWPASEAAAAQAKQRPELSIGLHVDLGEWLYDAGTWRCTYLRVPLDDPTAVRAEVERQLGVFTRFFGRDPTHLDSHQHVHREEPVRSILVDLARRLGIPLRHLSPGLRYHGDFFGQTNMGEPRPEALSVDALLAILQFLPAGVVELACHPGYATDLRTGYASERALEVRTLCDPRIRAATADRRLALCSFADIRVGGREAAEQVR